MTHRKNETQRPWFRSERVFRSNGSSYFHTREGIDVGPFQSLFEAQVESSILKNILAQAKTRDGALSAIREFLLDARTASSDLSGFTDYVVKEGRF